MKILKSVFLSVFLFIAMYAIGFCDVDWSSVNFPIVKFIGSKIKNELLKTTIQNILLLLILLFSIVLLINNSYNPFIYFRF